MALITSIGPITTETIARADAVRTAQAAAPPPPPAEPAAPARPSAIARPVPPPSGPTPPSAPARATPPEAVRSAELIEDRWALVFDGGVSLAIWEYGIARELLDAARAPQEGTDSPRTRIYRDALARSGRLLRLDIAAGTSAGGINGIFLSDALATGGILDPLEKLWMRRASIPQLLKVLHPTSWRKPRAGRAVFSGWRMGQWLVEAMRNITAGAAKAEPANVDLFVTATDLVGYDQTVLASGRATGDVGRQNRMVFRFSSEAGEFSNVGDPFLQSLAFAARCTSSFPGAFAASSLRTFPDYTDDVMRTARAVFGDYPTRVGLDRFPDVRFADGGLLDNSPFDLVIEAISARSAQRRVDRSIVHINPDPERAVEPLAEEAPRYRFVEGIRKALAVQSSQSILADLLEVEKLNAEIAKIAAMSADLEQKARELIRQLPPDAAATPSDSPWASPIHDGHALAGESLQRDALALDRLTYERLKIDAIGQMMAADILQLLSTHDGTAPASAVTESFATWASVDFWRQGTDESRIEFLRDADLPYQERRLRLLIANVNELFSAPDGENAAQDAASAKGGLWNILDGLLDLRRRAVIAERDAVFDVFAAGSAAITAEAVGALAERLREQYASFHLSEQLAQVFPAVDDSRALMRVSEVLRWFPLWDQAVYPSIALTSLPQLTPITVTRFSSGDVKFRPVRPVELTVKGVKFGHFGAFFWRSWRENDYVVGRVQGTLLILAQLEATEDEQNAAVHALVDELRNDRLLGKPATKKLLARLEAAFPAS